MKKIYLDSKRSIMLLADTVEQEGEFFYARLKGIARKIPAEKVLYIEEDGKPSERVFVDEPTYAQAPPKPILSNAFNQAVEKSLNNSVESFFAPEREMVRSTEEKEKEEYVLHVTVNSPSSSNTWGIDTTKESFLAADVTEELARTIFQDAGVKRGLMNMHVKSFVKKGDSVIISVVPKEAPRANLSQALSSLTNVLPNVIPGMPKMPIENISPVKKLPDLVGPIDLSKMPIEEE